MLQNLRTSGIIMLALLGTACILSLLVTAVTMLTDQSVVASDLLPAKHTRLFIERPNQQLLAAIKPWFPDLPEVKEGTEAIALTSSGYTIFTRIHGRLEPSIPLDEGVPSLSSLQEFQQLHGGKSTPWAYVDTQALPSAFAFLQHSEAIGISSKSGVQNISLALQSLDHPPAIEEDVALFFSNPFFVWKGFQLPEHRKKLLNVIAKEERDVSNALFKKNLHHYFGESTSWEYDIAPLLKGNTTIELQHSGSGELLFAVHGTAPIGFQVEEALDALRTSFAKSFTDNIEIRSQKLSDRFHARDARINEHRPPSEMYELNGWLVHNIPELQQRPLLLTANKGRRFVLTNVEAVQDMIEQDVRATSITLPTTDDIERSDIFAGGYIDAEAVQTLLHGQPSSLQGQVQTVLSAIGTQFTWSLGTKKSVLQFQVQQKEQ